MRMLDNAVSTITSLSLLVEHNLSFLYTKLWKGGCCLFQGFRTGYIYRHPLVKGEPPRPRNDVEVPPAVSSLGYLLEEEELYKHGWVKLWTVAVTWIDVSMCTYIDYNSFHHSWFDRHSHVWWWVK
jgi:hypothetical protein